MSAIEGGCTVPKQMLNHNNQLQFMYLHRFDNGMLRSIPFVDDYYYNIATEFPAEPYQKHWIACKSM